MVLPQKAFIVLEIAKKFVQEFRKKRFSYFSQNPLPLEISELDDLLAHS